MATLSASSLAAENIAPTAWNTSAELGAIATSGNTEGASLTGKIDARQESENWTNQYILTGYFKEDKRKSANGESKRVRSAQRVSASAKAAYKMMKDGKKLFVLGSHVKDRFGAYTEYNSLAIGHSTRMFKEQDNVIELEVGPGYSSGTRAAGTTESGFTIRGAAALRWRLSPSAMFTHTSSVERGTSNVHSSAEASLSTKINGTMQMKASVVARNDTNVPKGKENTDTQTSVTLVYSF
ncbi:MAG: DUF481 domain-containing protein [Pseudomonadota bacterium]